MCWLVSSRIVFLKLSLIEQFLTGTQDVFLRNHIMIVDVRATEVNPYPRFLLDVESMYSSFRIIK